MLPDSCWQLKSNSSNKNSIYSVLTWQSSLQRNLKFHLNVQIIIQADKFSIKINKETTAIELLYCLTQLKIAVQIPRLIVFQIQRRPLGISLIRSSCKRTKLLSKNCLNVSFVFRTCRSRSCVRVAPSWVVELVWKGGFKKWDKNVRTVDVLWEYHSWSRAGSLMKSKLLLRISKKTRQSKKGSKRHAVHIQVQI